ncbi:MAG: gamma-glutamyl-gamma-aminobutyrate hydrolase family protein [Erysipelotrichaceae bacterium]|nr:gamma-glutamyl-gamma-aminobutyrate hydrolase family protein [Erysipelotrichaceae bacterium]
MNAEERKPRIAISAENFNFQNYVDAIRAAGGEPEVFDPQKGVGYYDGLVLPGGGDVDPRLYGQSNTFSKFVKPELDALERDCLELFAEAGKPVLGICRGQQLINVAYGGSLIQDLRSEIIHHDDGPDDVYHEVKAIRKSFLTPLYGYRFKVNSSHHQAVIIPGTGFESVLIADDGTVEATQHESLPIYTVQFHPERMGLGLNSEECADGLKLIRWFVEECGRKE